MRRIRPALLIALLAAVVLASAAVASTTTASNHRAATVDARRLLKRVVLPAGATPSATEPSGDGGLLKAQLALDSAGAQADAHAWWVVPGDPGTVLSYVEAHKPAGVKQVGTGSYSDGRTGLSSESVVFFLPPVGRVLGTRELTVTVTALPGGRTGVLAESESVWIVARSPKERIPAGVSEIDIARGAPGQKPTLSLTVTDASKIHRVVRLIDGLEIGQPGAYSCPAELVGSPVDTFTFVAAGGAVLARAVAPADAAPATECDGITLTIRGHSEPGLIGNFVAPVEHLLGVNLG